MTITGTFSTEGLLSGRYSPSSWRTCHCFHREGLLPAFLFF